jgi:hypothetical protein
MSELAHLLLVLLKGWNGKIADSIPSKPLDTFTWNTIFVLLMSFDSSIDKATGYRLGRSSIFLLSIASRLPLGLTQPPILLVPWALSSRLKRSRHEADHSPPSIAEVKNSSHVFTAWCLINQAQGQPHLSYALLFNFSDLRLAKEH